MSEWSKDIENNNLKASISDHMILRVLNHRLETLFGLEWFGITTTISINWLLTRYDLLFYFNSTNKVFMFIVIWERIHTNRLLIAFRYVIGVNLLRTFLISHGTLLVSFVTGSDSIILNMISILWTMYYSSLNFSFCYQHFYQHRNID